MVDELYPIFSPSETTLTLDDVELYLTADPAVYGIWVQSRHRGDPLHFLIHFLVTTSKIKVEGHLQLIDVVRMGTQLVSGAMHTL